MTTDPTYEDTYDPTIDIFQMMKPYRGGDSFYTIDPAGVIDAWLRATVACPQCQGTGTDPTWLDDVEARYPRNCPGPHTQITIGDCVHGETRPHGGDELLQPCPGNEILYADPERIRWCSDDPDPITYQIMLPLPPGWTVA